LAPGPNLRQSTAFSLPFFPADRTAAAHEGFLSGVTMAQAHDRNRCRTAARGASVAAEARAHPVVVPAFRRIAFFVGTRSTRSSGCSGSASPTTSSCPRAGELGRFANYIEAMNDPLMWTSLWRAALFTMMFLPGTIILPLLLAVLIDKVTNQKVATVYRVILLIPAVIPSTLVFVLWKWMYNYPGRAD
jgi:ABC-type sugar transport system permease subunit